jgi:site-specific DNA-methyltransferase (adenine-specific)
MSFARNKGTQKALFSATENTPRGDEWETPANFFRELDREFHFTLDACASEANAKVQPFISKQVDALTVTWRGVVWCNPPYGRDIGLWLRKGRMKAAAGATVVFLIHARTDTRWFHEHVYHVADEIRFVRGRLKFRHSDGSTGSAPFPSMLVIYKPKARTQ